MNEQPGPVEEIATDTMPSTKDMSVMSSVRCVVTHSSTPEPVPLASSNAPAKMVKRTSRLARLFGLGRRKKKKSKGKDSDASAITSRSASTTSNTSSRRPFAATRRVREISITSPIPANVSSVKNDTSPEATIRSCQPTPTERHATTALSTSHLYDSVGPATSSEGSARRRIRDASITFKPPPQSSSVSDPLAAFNRIREISIQAPRSLQRQPSGTEAKAYIRSCRPTAAQRHCTRRSKLRNTEHAPPSPPRKDVIQKSETSLLRKASSTSTTTTTVSVNSKPSYGFDNDTKNDITEETEEERDHRRRIRRVGRTGSAAVVGSFVGGACLGPIGAAVVGAGAAATTHTLVVRGERKKDERVLLKETFEYNCQQPQIEIT